MLATFACQGCKIARTKSLLGCCTARCAKGSQMSTIPVQVTLPAQHKSKNFDFPDTATWGDVKREALKWSKLSADTAKVGIRGREIEDGTPLSDLKSTHRKLQAQVTMRPKKNLTDDTGSGSGSKKTTSSKPKAPPKIPKKQIDSACAGLMSYADQVCNTEGNRMCDMRAGASFTRSRPCGMQASAVCGHEAIGHRRAGGSQVHLDLRQKQPVAPDARSVCKACTLPWRCSTLVHWLVESSR